MTQHTPGPWKVEAGDGWRAIASSDSRTGFVAKVRQKRLREHAVAEMDANARLIAAAPDLLEIIKAVYSALQDECGREFRESCPAIWDGIEEAIAKAEGR